MLMYVPIVYGFLPEINVFVFVFVFVSTTDVLFVFIVLQHSGGNSTQHCARS